MTPQAPTGTPVPQPSAPATTIAPPGASPAAFRAPSAPRPSVPARQRRTRQSRPWRAAGTPGRLRLLLIALTSGSLAWGAVAAWTVSQHASAASQVVTASEPLSLDAQQMYRSLADADVTATTAYLSGPPEPLSVRRRFEADIARAAADLAKLRGARAAAGGGRAAARLSASLAAISAGLPVYTGYVQQAQTYSSLGYPLTGGSFMQVASEEMHLKLLPAARSSYARVNAALTAASARASGLPWIAVTLVLAVVLAAGLVRVQRWLRRRTHRQVNYGLGLATLAVAIGIGWLAVAFATARSDFQRGVGHGSAPAEVLARAGIAAQQARGDEVLNLISRSGATSFQQDFAAMRGLIGPGRGTLLSAAAASSRAGAAQAAVTAAKHDAGAWYAVTGRVFTLDLSANYAAETGLVIGTGPNSSAARFARFESDIGRAISADQVVFHRGATAGSGAYADLEAGLIAAALAMAAASAWGLSRRLAEYR